MTAQPQDLARTLVRRQRVARQAYETRALDLRQALDVVTRQLASEGLMAKAWLIGSLANGTFGPGSDVDIVVGGSQPSDYGKLWNRFFVGERDVDVATHPLDLLGEEWTRHRTGPTQTLLERDPRSVAEQLFGFGDVGVGVVDVTAIGGLSRAGTSTRTAEQTSTTARSPHVARPSP